MRSPKPTHRSVLCVTLLLLLCCGALPTMVHGQTAMDLTAAFNGPSFFWQLILDEPMSTSVLTNYVETDFTTMLTSIGTPAVTAVFVNATAGFVNVTVTPTGTPAATEAEVMAALMSGPLPTLSANMEQLLSGIPAIADFDEIVPADVRVVQPLLPPPEGSAPVTPPPQVVDVVESTQKVLFSGSPDSWATIVKTSRNSVVSAICAAVESELALENVTTTCTGTVSSYPADPSRTNFGNGAGGLLAELKITQSLLQGSTRHYSDEEISSMLMSMNVSTIEALYSAGGGNTTTPVSVVTAQSPSQMQKGGIMCHQSCAGIIGMSAAIVLVMLLTLLITGLAVCCCLATASSASREARGEKGAMSPGKDRNTSTTAVDMHSAMDSDDRRENYAAPPMYESDRYDGHSGAVAAAAPQSATPTGNPFQPPQRMEMEAPVKAAAPTASAPDVGMVVKDVSSSDSSSYADNMKQRGKEDDAVQHQAPAAAPETAPTDSDAPVELPMRLLHEAGTADSAPTEIVPTAPSDSMYPEESVKPAAVPFTAVAIPRPPPAQPTPTAAGGAAAMAEGVSASDSQSEAPSRSSRRSSTTRYEQRKVDNTIPVPRGSVTKRAAGSVMADRSMSSVYSEREPAVGSLVPEVPTKEENELNIL